MSQQHSLYARREGRLTVTDIENNWARVLIGGRDLAEWIEELDIDGKRIRVTVEVVEMVAT